jgi:hypothetical protein
MCTGFAQVLHGFCTRFARTLFQRRRNNAETMPKQCRNNIVFLRCILSSSFTKVSPHIFHSSFLFFYEYSFLCACFCTRLQARFHQRLGQTFGRSSCCFRGNVFRSESVRSESVRNESVSRKRAGAKPVSKRCAGDFTSGFAGSCTNHFTHCFARARTGNRPRRNSADVRWHEKRRHHTHPRRSRPQRTAANHGHKKRCGVCAHRIGGRMAEKRCHASHGSRWQTPYARRTASALGCERGRRAGKCLDTVSVLAWRHVQSLRNECVSPVEVGCGMENFEHHRHTA